MVKNLPSNVGDIRDVGSFSGLGRSPGGGHGIPWTGKPGGLESIELQSHQLDGRESE